MKCWVLLSSWTTYSAESFENSNRFLDIQRFKSNSLRGEKQTFFCKYVLKKLLSHDPMLIFVNGSKQVSVEKKGCVHLRSSFISVQTDIKAYSIMDAVLGFFYVFLNWWGLYFWFCDWERIVVLKNKSLRTFHFSVSKELILLCCRVHFFVTEELFSSLRKAC